MCWPANIMGAFALSLIIFDMVRGEWGYLPYHGVAGIFLVGVIWALCNFISVSVAAAVLLVPAIFIFVFLFTIWFTEQSLKNQECCMTCGGDVKNMKNVKKNFHIVLKKCPGPAPRPCPAPGPHPAPRHPHGPHRCVI